MLEFSDISCLISLVSRFIRFLKSIQKYSFPVMAAAATFCSTSINSLVPSIKPQQLDTTTRAVKCLRTSSSGGCLADQLTILSRQNDVCSAVLAPLSHHVRINIRGTTTSTPVVVEEKLLEQAADHDELPIRKRPTKLVLSELRSRSTEWEEFAREDLEAKEVEVEEVSLFCVMSKKGKRR